MRSYQQKNIYEDKRWSKSEKRALIEKRLSETRIYPCKSDWDKLTYEQKSYYQGIVQRYLMARNVEEKRQILIKNGIIKPLND